MKIIGFIMMLFALGFEYNCQNTNNIDQKKFNFEDYEINQTPQGWATHLTGKGKMCKWEILNDNGNKVLAQVSSETPDYRFNIIVNDSLRYKNVQINVKFKGVDGKMDQGGGPVWRYLDANNYYVARANPLENNFRLYKVVNGNRKELKNADITIDSNKWYDLKITMEGNKIQCYFNGKLSLERNFLTKTPYFSSHIPLLSRDWQILTV